METTTDTGATTRALLACGALAGPVYVITALAQGLTRQGFDLLRHDVSLLANGPMGWIQTANFLLTGALVVACAVGVRRAAGAGRRATWGSVLVGVYGLGVLGGGVFPADPVSGFPPGTPGGVPATVSVPGTLHVVSAGLGFLALVAACFVLARGPAAPGGRGWAVCSRLCGVLFLAGFGAGISAPTSPAGVLALWAAVVIGWAWLLVLAVRTLRTERTPA
ncbi:MAG TPA: DUF998 domain-containing protein [Streptosporangiaceae bacterium]|jgi:hypothetical membrane protein